MRNTFCFVMPLTFNGIPTGYVREIANVQGFMAFYAMCRLVKERRPFSVVWEQMPQNVVHYEGNGKPPYFAFNPINASYGGMSRRNMH